MIEDTNTKLPNTLVSFIEHFLSSYKFPVMICALLSVAAGFWGPFNSVLIKQLINLLPDVKNGDISILLFPASLIVINFIVFDNVTWRGINYILAKYVPVIQNNLRNHIAMIPQDPSLFQRSLMENIRYGRSNASDEEVIGAAKKAHAHEFIEKLSQGYDALVGERGVKLSGGQRQRIAISRAILKNAPILVLDEATSQLDSVTENLIQGSLWELMQDKTTIVIAHRLSTLLHMDRILVFDKGKIVQDGTHQNLLEQGGLYKNLWDAQVGGFLRDEKSEDDL